MCAAYNESIKCFVARRGRGGRETERKCRMRRLLMSFGGERRVSWSDGMERYSHMR